MHELRRGWKRRQLQITTKLLAQNKRRYHRPAVVVHSRGRCRGASTQEVPRDMCCQTALPLLEQCSWMPTSRSSDRQQVIGGRNRTPSQPRSACDMVRQLKNGPRGERRSFGACQCSAERLRNQLHNIRIRYPMAAAARTGAATSEGSPPGGPPQPQHAAELVPLLSAASTAAPAASSACATCAATGRSAPL